MKACYVILCYHDFQTRCVLKSVTCVTKKLEVFPIFVNLKNSPSTKHSEKKRATPFSVANKKNLVLYW